MALFEYGTAGFRDHADLMDEVVYRCGLVAALRSCSLSGSTVGLMITASHNPVEENGVKLVEPDGSMLVAEWEAIANRLVNVDASEVDAVVRELTDGGIIPRGDDQTESSDIERDATQSAAAEGRNRTLQRAKIVIGRDTRPSSLRLKEQACLGARQQFGGELVIEDIDVCTTPTLHWCVKNQESSMEVYLEALHDAYGDLVLSQEHNDHAAQSIWVDCANGVGTKAMEAVERWELTSIRLFNVGEGDLNLQCGADFVQKHAHLPIHVPQVPSGDLIASLDGDADRVVFYYLDVDRGFHLLDGDKIATLFTVRVSELLEQACLQDRITLGVVQTAYANGASTAFLTSRGLKVVCTRTGVKYLESEARKFDIGIYFEANGHGTVLFSSNAILAIEDGSPSEPESVTHAKKELVKLSRLANQAIGDGVADLLLVDIILRQKKWAAEQWDQLYRPLPSRQLKVDVRNRSLVETEDMDRRIRSPVGLQMAIDDILQKACLPQARCFVRPSGTEDVVRIYVEADSSQERLDELAQDVAAAVTSVVGN
uniref:Phosphoacetylglucosamine mutase n=1 Tax=Compsopogon caeruleus TaxID=31354 RepID=A0A7S1TBD3_9RHOD|mmetsp:Transcript_14878/g.30259  ORF Transcript_14878/g.30259 Transcript_14878/m.30259 type:complete len:542 (+) Transcript_14878:112-1737(+)